MEFYEDLINWTERWNTEPIIEIMISLHDNYPSKPPEIRLLRPILEYGTGGITNGFFIGIPRLLPLGWNPYCSLSICLQWIRDCLWQKEAKVNKETNAFYNIQTYSATRKLITSFPAPQLRHPTKFVKKLIAYSGAYCDSVLQVPMRPDFHYGNKVLLPPATLELLVRTELQDTAKIAQQLRSQGIQGSGLAALLSESENSSTSESAMVFELVSPLGFPIYAGVAEFTAPEPNMIILPEPVMTALAINEGTEITVSRVSLEPATTIVLQPHSTSFHAVEEFTGKEPRQFLEESLVSYSCLQAGTVILCSGGNGTDEDSALALAHPELGLSPHPNANLSIDPDIVMLDNGNYKIIPPSHVFRFNVVSVKPEISNNAVALFVGFQSQVNIEFLPAVDEFSIAASPRDNKNNDNNNVPIYQGPSIVRTTTNNINRTNSNTSAPNRTTTNQSAGNRYAPIAQATVEYDPAAHLINGIIPMIPIGNNQSSSNTGYVLGSTTQGGNTLGTSSTTTNSRNINISNNDNNLMNISTNGSRLLFNPVPVSSTTSRNERKETEEINSIPMIPVSSSTASTGATLGSTGLTLSNENSASSTPTVSNSNNPLAQAAAEREARRKLQAEALAKRMGASDTKNE